MDVLVTLRPETGRMLERVTAFVVTKRGAPVSLSEAAAIVLECGFRALAEDAKEKTDADSMAMKHALLGL